jgi:internalin A
VVAVLARLGATITPYDESSELLSVTIRTAHPEKDPFDTHGWTGSDDDLVQIRQLHDVAYLNFGYRVKDQRSLRFLPELPNLRVLNDSVQAISDDGMEYVGKCAALEKFTAISGISDVGLKRLTHATRLADVVIACSRVTDNGLEGIERLKHLESLAFIWSKITDRGLKKIVALPALRDLNLSDAKITDAGVEMLGSCKSLKHLGISGTMITDKGVAKLRSLIPGCDIEAKSPEPSASSTRQIP